MDYDSMSKEQLIKLLRELELKRAYTYEDRMKLTILDNLPFTVWASDRDCVIRLWEGQCEAMYGYRKSETLGKNYVELFVAPDEKAAARRDQLKIIDENETFHNIANDHGRYGNVLRLITNCCRIKDPDTGEYLNAEMGVSIAYYEEEKKILEENIEEGRQMQSFSRQFVADQQQHKDMLQERCDALWDSIRTGKAHAGSKGRLDQYKVQISPIENGIVQSRERFNDLLLVYKRKVSECLSYEECEKIKSEYLREYNMFLDEFSELAISLENVNAQFTNALDLTAEKDEAMNEVSRQSTKLAALAQTIFNKAEGAYNKFKSICNDPSSTVLQTLDKFVNSASLIREEIYSISSDIHRRIASAMTKTDIDITKDEVQKKCTEIKTQLTELNDEIEPYV